MDAEDSPWGGNAILKSIFAAIAELDLDVPSRSGPNTNAAKPANSEDTGWFRKLIGVP